VRKELFAIIPGALNRPEGERAEAFESGAHSSERAAAVNQLIKKHTTHQKSFIVSVARSSFVAIKAAVQSIATPLSRPPTGHYREFVTRKIATIKSYEGDLF